MDEEEAVRTFDLEVRGRTLPATIEELVPMSFVTEAALKAYELKVKLLKDLKAAEDQLGATVKDGQEVFKAQVKIETKIGQLAARTPQLQTGGVPAASDTRRAKKHERLGIPTRDRMLDSEAIASDEGQKAIKEVIEEAEKKNEIPTKKDVIAKVRAARFKKKHPHEKELPNINKVALAIHKQLTGAYSKLVQVWPEKEHVKEELIESIVGIVADLTKLTGRKK